MSTESDATTPRAPPDHLLAAGAQVTVTEMSAPSVRFLRSRFRRNPNVTVLHDQDGSAARRTGSVDAVVCLSVLHHIPDYLGTVGQLVERIAPGGAFLSAQDPLWYPRRSRLSMSLDRNAYYLRRLGQGVDEQALRELLAPAFEKGEVQRYWLTQSGVLQAVGE